MVLDISQYPNTKEAAHLLPFANNFGTLIYVVFLACIFVELFLNKECTYLDDF